MRNDGADHAGAVWMRLLGAADGVVPLDDRAGEVGVVDVDLGIDHRDHDVVSGRELVRRVEMQLLDDVLVRRAAARPGRQLGNLE